MQEKFNGAICVGGVIYREDVFFKARFPHFALYLFARILYP